MYIPAALVLVPLLLVTRAKKYLHGLITPGLSCIVCVVINFRIGSSRNKSLSVPHSLYDISTQWWSIPGLLFGVGLLLGQ